MVLKIADSEFLKQFATKIIDARLNEIASLIESNRLNKNKTPADVWQAIQLIMERE